jgi:hypothetical protein
MLARVIWKIILALCVVLAIALVVTGLRTRRSDLVASGASNGTYRELRIGGGGVGLTAIPQWPDAEKVRVGRPPGARVSPLPQTVTPAPGPTFTLLDGTTMTLVPSSPAAAGSWLHWPPTQSKGTIFIHGLPAKHRRAATMPAGTVVNLSTGTWNRAGGVSMNSYSGTTQIKITPGVSGKVTLAPAATTSATASASVRVQRFPTTSAGTGTITIVGPSTMPTLSNPGPAGTTASAVIASLKSDTDISFRTPPRPNTALPPLSGTSSLTITGSAIFMIPTYSFERYAVSVWLVAAIILLPVWCAIALATARAFRRRVRRRRGLCEACGYDLRGSPPGGACPECGASTSKAPVAPSGDELLARLR